MPLDPILAIIGVVIVVAVVLWALRYMQPELGLPPIIFKIIIVVVVLLIAFWIANMLFGGSVSVDVD